MATKNFDETIELQVQLGIDPRKPNQNVRGVAQLPHGSGKSVSIAVFARGEKADEARRAGATLVGAEDLVDKISKGEISFNKTIATPDMMPLVGKVARILGPRGLMPNPKLGTVTLNLSDAVMAAKRGQAEFKAEKRGIISSGFGKASFQLGNLKDNLKALLLAISDAKPEGLKGNYIRSAFMKSTMGPGVPVDINFIDPSSPTFLQELTDLTATAAASSSPSSGTAAT
jgi:large subunit ribosomal protein L1